MDFVLLLVLFLKPQSIVKMKSIKFSKNVVAKGKTFIQVDGIDCYDRKSLHYGVETPETPDVLCLTPLFGNHARSVEVEIPVEDVPSFIRLLGSQLPRAAGGPNTKTNYQAWLDGDNHPGSFELLLVKTYAVADEQNMRSLEAVFPQFFINKKIW